MDSEEDVKEINTFTEEDIQKRQRKKNCRERKKEIVNIDERGKEE